jgi:putative spermidine/putrescine transport system permease protein
MRAAHEFSPVALGAWTTLVCIFLIAPLGFVVAVSLTPLDYVSLPSGGLSLKWYRQMATHGEFIVAAMNSLWLACGAALTALVLGVLAAIASVRYRFALLQPLRLAVTSPLFIPMIMSGLAILAFAASVGVESQGLRLYAGHAVLTVPYVFRTVSASLSGFDVNQELAARNLGAPPLKAFMLITVPQLRAGLVAGGLFAFIVSFDNVGLSIFLTGAQYSTLPVQLFTYASYSNDPMAAAVSVAMIALSLVVIAAVEWFFGLERLMRA